MCIKCNTRIGDMPGFNGSTGLVLKSLAKISDWLPCPFNCRRQIYIYTEENFEEAQIYCVWTPEFITVLIWKVHKNSQIMYLGFSVQRDRNLWQDWLRTALALPFTLLISQCWKPQGFYASLIWCFFLSDNYGKH